MAVTITCTAMFGSDAGRGWSESHKLSVASAPTDLLPIMQAFKTLMDNCRRPLLAQDRFLKGLKVSFPTPQGAIASSPYRYSPFSYPTNKNDGCAPSVAAECRMGEVTNTQFSNIYLRGFWDDVERNEQLDFTTAKGKQWKDLLDLYIAALVQGKYGWDAQDQTFTSRGEITGYIVGIDGRVTFTINNTAGGPTPVAGTIAPFRPARLNNSKSPLNTEMQVVVIDAHTVKSVKQLAAGPKTSDGTYVMAFQTFAQYTGSQYCVLAKKSEGRPTGLSPARQKAKARY